MHLGTLSEAGSRLLSCLYLRWKDVETKNCCRWVRCDVHKDNRCAVDWTLPWGRHCHQSWWGAQGRQLFPDRSYACQSKFASMSAREERTGLQKALLFPRDSQEETQTNRSRKIVFHIHIKKLWANSNRINESYDIHAHNPIYTYRYTRTHTHKYNTHTHTHTHTYTHKYIRKCTRT